MAQVKKHVRVKGELNPERPNKAISPDVIEVFAQTLTKGKSQTEAYRESHPDVHVTDVKMWKLASEFAHLPVVEARVKEIREETSNRWGFFKDELVSMLTEEIRTCYEENRTLGPVMKQVDSVTKILGLEKQTIKVEQDTGAVEADSVVEKINFLVDKAKKGDK